MIKMEFAKFAYKFYNKKLPNSFDNYFTDLKYIHNYITRQKDRSNFYHRYVRSETGRKKLQHLCVNVWKNIPLQSRNCSFVIFKKNLNKTASPIIAIKMNYLHRRKRCIFHALT